MKEWRVARQPLAAVVVGEDDERPFPQTETVDRRENPSDAAVGMLHHRDVLGARARRLIVALQVTSVVAGHRRLARTWYGKWGAL
jgi:hypothetical protein